MEIGRNVLIACARGSFDSTTLPMYGAFAKFISSLAASILLRQNIIFHNSKCRDGFRSCSHAQLRRTMNKCKCAIFPFANVNRFWTFFWFVSFMPSMRGYSSLGSSVLRKRRIRMQLWKNWANFMGFYVQRCVGKFCGRVGKLQRE